MKVKSKKFKGVYIYKSTNNSDECYYISYWAYGRKVNEKVGWKSENYTQEQAHKIRVDRIHAIRHGEELPDKGKKALTLDSIWEMFSPTLRLEANKTTVRVAKARYNIWIAPKLGTKRLQTITPKMIQDIFDEMAFVGLAEGTRYHYYNLLSRIFKYAIEERHYKGKNPMMKVEKPLNKKIRQRWLTKEEASKLLQAANIYSTDLYLQTALMLFTGMRVSEVMGIRGRDINFEANQIYVLGKGKDGGKERFCEMNAVVKDLLLQHPLDPGEALFKKRFNREAWDKIVNDLGFNKGVEDNDPTWKVTPHTLRHTFGSWLAQNGTDIRISKSLLGHSRLETTMRYEKLAPRPGTEAVAGLVEGITM